MPTLSVFCHLSCNLVSRHVLFQQVLSSQLWSVSISLSIYCNIIIIWYTLYPGFAHVQTISNCFLREFCHQVQAVHACLFLGVYISHKILVFSPAPETFPISSRFLPGVPGFPIHSYSVLRSRPGSSLERFPSIFISTTALMFSVSSLLFTCPNLVILLLLVTIIIGPTFSSS